MNYSIGKYGRRKWAVFCATTRTWYFADKSDKVAAQALADRLNREI